MRISDEERWKNGISSHRKSLLRQERINEFGHSGGGVVVIIIIIIIIIQRKLPIAAEQSDSRL